MEIYFAFSGFFNATASTLLGLLVFLKNKKSLVNRAFAILCLADATWSFPYIFWPLAKTSQEALFWFQLLHIGASFTSIAYLHFASSWLDLYKNKIKKIVRWGYLLAFCFSLSVFSPLFIKEMVPKFTMRFWAVPGPLYHFYLLMFFGYAIYSFYLLITNYKKTSGIKRIQLRYLLIGMIISYIGGSTNYPLWYNINFPPYGNILASAYLILSAYTIIRYRFMDIRLVVKQVTIYGFSFFVSIGLSLLLMLAALNYSSFYISSPWIGSLILVFGIIIFQLVKEKFSKFANKHLFYTLYSYEKTLADLTEKLSRSIDLNRLVSLTTETIKDVMKLDKICLVLHKITPPKGELKILNNHQQENNNNIVKENKDEADFYLAQNIDFKEKNIDSLAKNKILVHYLENSKKPLVKDEIEHLIEEFDDRRDKEIFKKLEESMKEIEANLYLPLIIEDRLIGLFILGKKISGDAYTIQDLSLLETVANQIAIAINNAQLYEQSQYFNQILRVRVAEATQELAGAYRELKKLDDSKTEFLSLASHQLRTPLSAIKGYLSMVMEGDFGKLQKETETAIKNVYQSNERLIALVNDLLNITRIEAGKLEYHSRETDFGKLVEGVIKELEMTAKTKGLELKQKLSKLPLINIDPDKIRQVLMNLIDNALKYTEKGNVVVHAKKVDGHILVEVKDTGIGISRDKTENLFEWFSRGKGALRLDSGGFGLGLYIAKKIIEKANGKIWAESPGENKGSTFTFSLPIK